MPQLILPYPVSANRYWRHFRGRTVVSKEAKHYRAQVMLEAARAGVGQPLDGPVALRVAYHPKMPKKWRGGPVRTMDLSNVLKVAEDALNGIAWRDDSQVTVLSLARCGPVPGGQLIVHWEAV